MVERNFTSPWILGLALLLGAARLALAQSDAAEVPESRPAASTAPPTASNPKARLYANAFALWIYGKPRKSRVPIGYIRAGQALTLRLPHAVGFEGCKRGWYAVEPTGYVCVDQSASFESTRYNQAMQTLAPESGPYPFTFGVSLGTLSYRRLPKPGDEAFRRQSAPIEASAVDLRELMTDATLDATQVPWFLEHGGSVSRAREERLLRRLVPAQTLLSLVSRFELQQSYYQVADGTIVPAERIKLLRQSTFEGVWLTENQPLPLAWTREEASIWRLTEACMTKLVSEFPRQVLGQLSVPINVHSKCLLRTDKRVPPRVPVALSGRTTLISGAKLLETRDGEWLYDTAVRVALLETPKHAVAAADKWIHFSIQRGTLVAYEGVRPVFATLASPGSGEPNARGALRVTPKGTFRINFKHITDDMSSEDGEHRSEWKADVPYAMYFNQPYGIHVSYWHEAFGEPKSGGCINVSPIDGARLFDWTEPRLPSGWYGVGSSRDLGLGTVVHVTD